MKKLSGIITVCISVILGILLWRMSIRNVDDDNQVLSTKITQQQVLNNYSNTIINAQDKKDDEEDENEDEYDEKEETRLNQHTAFDLLPARVALREGAEAMVTFRVIDSLGKPIEDAKVIVALYPKTEAKAEKTEGRTNENGMFTISGKTKSYIGYVARKDGYYWMEWGKYWVYKGVRSDCVQDGKWMPWNPTIEITLNTLEN